jgi:hypothetical protein
MMIDELLKNPLVKRALAVGEERMGKMVTQLLSNERVMHGVQTVVASALNAKSSLDRGVRTAMQAVNLPTTEDVEELRRKLAELEVRRPVEPHRHLAARAGRRRPARRARVGAACGASPSSTRRAAPARRRCA